MRYRAIEQADSGFEQLKYSTFSAGSKALNQASQALRANNVALAECITQEMGKPIQQSYAEVEKCAWVCEYFATNDQQHLSDETIKPGEKNAIVKALSELIATKQLKQLQPLKKMGGGPSLQHDCNDQGLNSGN